jgi:hypothetical protein
MLARSALAILMLVSMPSAAVRADGVRPVLSTMDRIADAPRDLLDELRKLLTKQPGGDSAR